MARNIVVGTKPIEIPSNTHRVGLVVANAATDLTLYYGHSDQVSTSNGIPVYKETVVSFGKIFGDKPEKALHLVSTGDCDVRIDETEEDWL